jgi:hypothetical protein
MPLNLADRFAVRAVIVPRCTAAVASYAAALLNPQVTANPTVPQLAWAREAIRQPAAVGDAVSWHVVPSQAFIDAGSGITDQDLDFLVQTAINAHFISSGA